MHLTVFCDLNLPLFTNTTNILFLYFDATTIILEIYDYIATT